MRFAAFVTLCACIAMAMAVQTYGTIANQTKQNTYGFLVPQVNSGGSSRVLNNGAGIVFISNPYGREDTLFIVSTNANRRGQVTQLSQENVVQGTDGNVQSLQLTPNEAYVVFTGVIDISGGPISIFSVPTWGGQINQVSGVVPTRTSNQIGSIIYKPDSSRIVWRAATAAASVGEATEIFSNDLVGTAVVRMNLPLGQKSDMAVTKEAYYAQQCGGSQNNRGFMYFANPGNAEDLDPLNLYFVNWDGTGNTQISPGSNPARRSHTNNFGGRWNDAGGEYFVYLNDEEVANQATLFSYHFGRSERIKLSGPQFAGTSISCNDWQITPDGKSVVFVERDDASLQYQLYSRNLDGTNLVKLDGPITYPAFQIKISADSKWVAYSKNTGTGMVVQDLFVARVGVEGSGIKATPVTQAAGVTPETDYRFVYQPGFGNVTNQLLYRTQQVAGIINIWSGFLPEGDTGPVSVQLLSAINMFSPGVASGYSGSTTQASGGWSISPDKKYVVFRGYGIAAGTQPQIWKVKIDGSAAPVLLGPQNPTTLQGALNFIIASDNKKVVFRAFDTPAPPLDVPDTFYSAQLPTTDGEEQPTAINVSPNIPTGFTTDGGYLASWELHPDGESVVYRCAQPEATQLPQLWSISVNGGELVQFSFNGFNVNTQGPRGDHAWLPDGRVVYSGDFITNGLNDYFTNRSAGSILAPALAVIAMVAMFF